MSQKPRADAQAKSASTAKMGAKEVVDKIASVNAAASATPVVKYTPTTNQEPIVEAVVPVALPIAEPVFQAAPVANVEPIAMPSAALPAVGPVGVSDAVVAATEIAAKTTEAVPEIATATMETVTATAAQSAAGVKPTTSTITQGMKTMMKSTEDLVAFGQANLEAFVKSGQIWSAGVQELTKQIATSAKASFEESVSTFKALSTVKSVKEAMELQSTFAKAALEKAMAESNKLTDASIKLTEQTLAPITARVTVAVETFGKAA